MSLHVELDNMYTVVNTVINYNCTKRVEFHFENK